MTTPSAPSIAIDAGTCFLRAARIREDGAPELVNLCGTDSGAELLTPEALRGDREAALRMAYTAYREQYGPPGEVVLVVPPDELAKVREKRAVPPGGGLLPRPRLLSTPHAVLALLLHAGTPIAPRLWVCDLGASAAEVAECVVNGGAAAVPRVARYAPPGDGYGAAFEAAVLVGARLPGDDPETRRGLAEGWRGNARRIDVVLGQMADRPDHADRFADTVLFEVAGRPITAGLVYRALDLLTGGLDGALDGLPGVRAADPDPDRPSVIAVGGAAWSGVLLRHLTGRLGPPSPLPGGTDPALAAVFGAALVAGGHVHPPDRYPHAVAVGVHRSVVGRPRDAELLISPPWTLEPGGATVFAEADGERVRVRTGSADGTGGREVRILVHAAATGAVAPACVVTVPPADDEAYFQVGVRVATDLTARLVLQPLGTSRAGAPHPPPGPPVQEIPLGVLPADPRPDVPPDPQPDIQGDRT